MNLHVSTPILIEKQHCKEHPNPPSNVITELQFQPHPSTTNNTDNIDTEILISVAR